MELAASKLKQVLQVLAKPEIKGFPAGSAGKESACNAETRVRSLGWEDPLEKGMVTHSSILAWRIPQTEEPGELWATAHGVAKSDLIE